MILRGAVELNLDIAAALEQVDPWGQGFAERRFDGGDQTHVKYRLRRATGEYEAIDFGGVERLVSKGKLRAIYALWINRYQGRESLGLRVEYLEAVGD